MQAVEQGPNKPLEMVILFALFACREVEAACRTVDQVTVEQQGPGCGVVSIFLPATKRGHSPKVGLLLPPNAEALSGEGGADLAR